MVEAERLPNSSRSLSQPVVFENIEIINREIPLLLMITVYAIIQFGVSLSTSIQREVNLACHTARPL